jgi:hypothetical protein
MFTSSIEWMCTPFLFQRLFAIDFSFPEDDDIPLMCTFGAWRVFLSGRAGTSAITQDRYWDCHSSLHMNTVQYIRWFHNIQQTVDDH